MPAGIQVFDATGVLQLDISNRVYRVLGYANTGVSDGNIPFQQPSAGQVVAVVEPGDAKKPPVVSISGGVASWNFGSAPIEGRSDSRVTIMAI